MTNVSISGAGIYMPKTILDNQHFIAASGVKKHPMFRGTKFRHHTSDDETATFMAVQSIKSVQKDLGLNLQKDVDILITNCPMSDLPFVGPGAAIVGELDLKPQHVYDLSNGGCISFVFMIELAKILMQSTGAKTAMLCNIQTTGGRVFGLADNLKLPQSIVPGDGCSAVYLTANDANPILTTITRTHGAYANDMTVKTQDGRLWWKPGKGTFNIDFDEDKISAIVSRGNELVPEVMYQALEKAKLQPEDINYLLTNQPNRIFLRNWRESLMLEEHQHITSLAEHGNLFGSGIPINLCMGVKDGRIKPGGHMMLAGFSHAGDYSAAAIVEWKEGF